MALFDASSEETPRRIKGYATTFGYNDPNDNGLGAWGQRTDNPDILGASLPISMLTAQFGNANAAKNKLVEVTNPKTGKSVVVPIVDKGPAEWVIARQGPTIDLTHAANKALGGTGKTPVSWRFLSDDEAQPTKADALPTQPIATQPEPIPTATPVQPTQLTQEGDYIDLSTGKPTATPKLRTGYVADDNVNQPVPEVINGLNIPKFIEQQAEEQLTNLEKANQPAKREDYPTLDAVPTDWKRDDNPTLNAATTDNKREDYPTLDSVPADWKQDDIPTLDSVPADWKRDDIPTLDSLPNELGQEQESFDAYKARRLKELSAPYSEKAVQALKDVGSGILSGIGSAASTLVEGVPQLVQLNMAGSGIPGLDKNIEDPTFSNRASEALLRGFGASYAGLDNTVRGIANRVATGDFLMPPGMSHWDALYALASDDEKPAVREAQIKDEWDRKAANEKRIAQGRSLPEYARLGAAKAVSPDVGAGREEQIAAAEDALAASASGIGNTPQQDVRGLEGIGAMTGDPTNVLVPMKAATAVKAGEAGLAKTLAPVTAEMMRPVAKVPGWVASAPIGAVIGMNAVPARAVTMATSKGAQVIGNVLKKSMPEATHVYIDKAVKLAMNADDTAKIFTDLAKNYALSANPVKTTIENAGVVTQGLGRTVANAVDIPIIGRIPAVKAVSNAAIKNVINNPAIPATIKKLARKFEGDGSWTDFLAATTANGVNTAILNGVLAAASGANAEEIGQSLGSGFVNGSVVSAPSEILQRGKTMTGAEVNKTLSADQKSVLKATADRVHTAKVSKVLPGVALHPVDSTNITARVADLTGGNITDFNGDSLYLPGSATVSGIPAVVARVDSKQPYVQLLNKEVSKAIPYGIPGDLAPALDRTIQKSYKPEDVQTFASELSKQTGEDLTDLTNADVKERVYSELLAENSAALGYSFGTPTSYAQSILKPVVGGVGPTLTGGLKPSAKLQSAVARLLDKGEFTEIQPVEPVAAIPEAIRGLPLDTKAIAAAVKNKTAVPVVEGEPGVFQAGGKDILPEAVFQDSKGNNFTYSPELYDSIGRKYGPDVAAAVIEGIHTGTFDKQKIRQGIKVREVQTQKPTLSSDIDVGTLKALLADAALTGIKDPDSQAALGKVRRVGYPVVATKKGDVVDVWIRDLKGNTYNIELPPTAIQGKASDTWNPTYLKVIYRNGVFKIAGTNKSIKNVAPWAPELQTVNPEYKDPRMVKAKDASSNETIPGFESEPFKL